MTRIAIDARKIDDFGIGSYLRGLIRGLAGLDRESRYTLLAPSAARSRLDSLPANFEWRDDASPGYSLAEQLLLGGRIRRLAPDLFHSPHYVLPLRTPAPEVVTVHDLIHLSHPEFLPHPLALAYAWTMFRRVARRARRVIAVSAATAADLEARLGIPRHRIEVIWNGIENRFLAPIAAAEVDRALARYDLLPGYFLFVGNPKPHKNLDRLLRAFGALEDPEARLVLVGGATPPGGDPRMRTLGRVDEEELPALYRGALALLFPSLAEGFGLPVVEAMAVGTPVVASTAPAVAEIAGGAALLAEPTDLPGWTAAMKSLRSDSGRRRELVELGRERALQFRWERAAQRTLEVYRSVLAERGT